MVADHIAFNFLVNKSGISTLDGFANFSEDKSEVLEWTWETGDV